MDRAGCRRNRPAVAGKRSIGRREFDPAPAASYLPAALLPAAMITKIAKATNAHQATLSVSFCHFRTSHMS